VGAQQPAKTLAVLGPWFGSTTRDKFLTRVQALYATPQHGASVAVHTSVPAASPSLFLSPIPTQRSFQP